MSGVPPLHRNRPGGVGSAWGFLAFFHLPPFLVPDLSPQKLPDLARSLGKGLAEFRRATEDFKQSVEDEAKAAEEKERIAKEVAAKEETEVAAPARETEKEKVKT